MINEERKIAMAFLAKPWKKLTYKEIRQLSGKKSKGYIYRALSHLLYEGIITTESVGKSILYIPNLASLKARAYFGMVEEYASWQEKQIQKKIVENIAARIKKVSPFFVLIVTGSYAKHTQKSQSDLDVAIVCDNGTSPKKIMAEINLESKTSIPKVHPFIFTRDEFLEMLLNDELNYGKETASNNLIFSGAESYYSMLNEAIQNGFKG